MKTNRQQPRLGTSFLGAGLPLPKTIKWATLNLAILAIIYPGLLQANPDGAQIVNGQVTIDTGTPGVTNITNSPNAIIHWQNFNIAQNEITRFIQQNGQSAVLNRIIGQNPSEILGQLLSNGKVFLINPNGVVFGAGSVVDTQGLLASSLNLSDQDFLTGNYHFVAGSGAGNIVNEGIIRTGKDGNIILIAPSIKNNGIIKSDGGQITLAAGQELTITNMDDPEIRFQVQAPNNEVLNLGKILSQGGAIDLFANSLKHSGEINADSVEMDEQGNIRLIAKQDISLAVDSLISANNSKGDAGTVHIESMTGTTTLKGTVEAEATQTGKGGKIELLGERVGVLGQAQIDADGENGGGQILVGGDYQGKNADIHNAQATFIGSETKITADAKTTGNGGKVIAWSEQSTRAHGKISAKGGSQGGDGGFIETSGHWLDTTGIKVDASAAKGKGGTWLLDPNDVTIQATGSNTNVSGGPIWTTTDGSAIVTTGSIEDSLNTGTSVTVSTGNAGANNTQAGNITVSSAISKTGGGDAGLTLNAHNDININASIKSTAGKLGLTLKPDSDGTDGGTATIANTVDLNAGKLTMNGATTLSGTVKNATLMNPGGATLSSINGTLDGITIGSSLTESGTMWVNNGLTLADGVELNIGDSSWRFQGTGTQSIATDGEATLTTTGGSLYSWDSGGQTLSIGSGVTISGYGFLSGAYSNDIIVNNGTILANTADQTLTINPTLFTNKGNLGISAGTLDLNATSWSNKNTLFQTGGIINLGGAFTTEGIGSISRIGGLLNLTGTLNNIGQTLDIGSSGAFGVGGLTQLSGTIKNGTLTSSDGTVLTSNSGTLDRVIIGSNLTDNGAVGVSNGLTLADGVTLNIGDSNWHFKGAIASLGNASIVTEGGTLSGQFLHINAGVTVSGYGFLSGDSDTGSIVNKGVILADTPGQNLTINSALFTNRGNLEVSAGTLNLNAAFWTNKGTLTETGGILNLGGTFNTPGIGNISRTAGLLNITGTLDNAGYTLDIGSSGVFGVGGLTQLSGAIKRGALTSSDGTLLNSNNGTLDRVTIGSDLAANGTMWVSNGLKLADGTTLNIGTSNWRFLGAGLQTIASPGGTASLVTEGGSLYSWDSEGQTLTINRGVTLSGYGLLSGAYNNDIIVNNGTILVNTPDHTLTINPAVFTNTGKMSVDAGTLDFNPISWSNDGTFTQTGGLFNLGGIFNTDDVGLPERISRTGGIANISGILDNTGCTGTSCIIDIGIGIKSAAVSGLSLSGTIKNGILISSSNQLKLTSDSGTLDNVTIASNLNESGTLWINNGLTLAPGVTVNTGASTWYFMGDNKTIATPGAATLTTAGGRLHSWDVGLLTIGSGITVSGYGDLYSYDEGAGILNNGTILADAPGKTLTVSGAALVNAGTLGVKGGTLNLEPASWSSTGELSVTSGILNLGSLFTTNDLGIINRTGGSVNVTGILNNTNHTLDIGGSGAFGVGGLTQLTGIIKNGRLTSSDGTLLRSDYGTLDNVTIGSNLSESGTLWINNSLTLANGVTVNAGANTWYFKGNNKVIATPGTAGLTIAGGRLHSWDTGLLTIGSGVTISGYGDLYGYDFGDGIHNNGTILADTLGKTLTISGAAFTNTGTLQATAGTLSLANFASNDGIIDVASGAVIQTDGNLINNINATIRGSGTLDLGSSAHTLTNNGTISPGSSPGYLNITGNLTLGHGSITEIELGGLFKGTGYDAIRTSGNIVIDPGAIMNVSHFGSFSASTGDVFHVFEADGTLSGTFSTLNFPASGFNAYYGDGKNLVLRDNTTNPVLIWSSDAGGNWDTAANWNLNRIPQAGDIVLVDRPTGDYTLTINSGSQFAGRLLSSEDLFITNGSLTLSGSAASGISYIDSTATLTLNNGNLEARKGGLTVNGGFNWSGGTVAGNGDFKFANGFNYTAGIMNATGSIDITDNSGSLILPAMHSITSLIARSGGDLILKGNIAATGHDDAIVLVANTKFDNSVGASLSAVNGRWLVYSDNWIDSIENGLTAAADSVRPRLYNMSYTDNAPAAIEAGNHLIYKAQPNVTVTADTQNKVYGDADPVLSYTVTGLVDDDNIIDVAANYLNFTGSLGRAAGESVAGGPYLITQGSLGLSSPGGYDTAYIYNETPAALTITPYLVNLTGIRIFDGTANVAAGIFTLGDLVGNETLTLSGSGTVANAFVGVAKMVNLGSLALGNGTHGGLAGNYTLSGGNHTADITPASLISWTGAINNDWANAGNWNQGMAPYNQDVVLNLPGSHINLNSGAYDILSLTSSLALNLAGGTLNAGQVLFQGGALNLLGGTLKADTLTLQNSAALNGMGPIFANIFNESGIVSPGYSPGALVINGNYNQGATGVLNIELSGLSSSLYDRLNISGSANLGGILQLTPTGAYVQSAQVDDRFDIIQASHLNGDFSTIQTLSGFAYEPVALADSYSIITTQSLNSPDNTQEPPPAIIQEQINVQQNEVLVLGQQGQLTDELIGIGTVSDIVSDDESETSGSPKQCK